MTESGKLLSLTAFNRPLPLSYSMTMIEQCATIPFYGTSYGSLEPFGTRTHNEVVNWLEQKDGWKNLFYHNDSHVVVEDFGTNTVGYQGLDDATFHIHMGHGSPIPPDIDIVGFSYPLLTYIPMRDRPLHQVFTWDVNKKWGNKNKWVWIQSCNVLSDKRWGGALNTSHGILGYSSYEWTSWNLTNYFFENSINDNRSIAQSYYIATVKAQTGPMATVIYRTQDQLYNDHLPGHGIIAPDESPDDNIVYYVDWCSEGRCEGS